MPRSDHRAQPGRRPPRRASPRRYYSHAIAAGFAHGGSPVEVPMSAPETASSPPPGNNAAAWPPLDLDPWHDTYQALHFRTQIVGKTRLALSPMENHWWQVAFYLTARGL